MYLSLLYPQEPSLNDPGQNLGRLLHVTAGGCQNYTCFSVPVLHPFSWYNFLGLLHCILDATYCVHPIWTYSQHTVTIQSSHNHHTVIIQSACGEIARIPLSSTWFAGAWGSNQKIELPRFSHSTGLVFSLDLVWFLTRLGGVFSLLIMHPVKATFANVCRSTVGCSMGRFTKCYGSTVDRCPGQHNAAWGISA